MFSKKSMDLRGRKICWISSLILDRDFHKTSRVEILKNLAERGHETSLFGVYSARYSKQGYQSEMKNIHVVSIALRYIPHLSTIMYTLLLFLYLPFHFVYSKTDFIIVEPRDSTFLGLMTTVLLPRSMRPKIVLDIRSTPVSESTETLLFKMAISIAKKLFDGMTIITPMMKKEICNKFHIDPEFVGIWPDGASTTLFNPKNYDGTAMRKRLGLDHKFVIFYHGSFGYSIQGGRRGISESIKSIEMLRNRYPDLILFLLGDSLYSQPIKRQIEECGVQDRVIIHDRVNYEDVPRYIALCDVGIVPLPDLPIWRHQCPLKLLEYLAMEKVVIVTDIPANRNVIGENECGVYVSSAEPEEIAKAIRYVYDNKRELNDWGAYGRTIIEEKYSWKKVAQNFEKYLLRLERMQAWEHQRNS